MTQSLLKETAAALQTLCSSCGLRKTGTKRILLQRLRLAAKHFQPLPPEARILSIDLGLKNFAFSLLSPITLPPKPKPKPKSTIKPPTPPTNPLPLKTPTTLHAWHRLDLTLPTTTTQQTLLLDNDAFSPAALSALTVDLIKTHLLPLRPTHVLIERQRFRTGGAAAIFEWTLRVNTLEAMLHAGFAALDWEGGEGGAGEKGSGSGLWRGRVHSVLPRAVVGFMFPSGEGVGEDGGEEGKGKKKVGSGAAYQVLKRKKVDVLGRLLGEKGGLVLPEKGQASEMTRLFLAALEKRGQRGGRRKTAAGGEEGEVEELVTKMDDLSDAVLQGMVWLQWQRNLEALIKERPELLDEADEDDV